MRELLALVGGMIDWVMRNPHYVAGGMAAVWALRWLLNRKSRLTRESEKALDLLQRKNQGKYDDFRPLR